MRFVFKTLVTDLFIASLITVRRAGLGRTSLRGRMAMEFALHGDGWVLIKILTVTDADGVIWRPGADVSYQ